MDRRNVEAMLEREHVGLAKDRESLALLVAEGADRIAERILRIERLKALLAASAVTPMPGDATPTPFEPRRSSGATTEAEVAGGDAPDRPGMSAAQAIMDALGAAGSDGLLGHEVDDAVVRGGRRQDAAAKAKTKLKNAGEIVRLNNRWYLKGKKPDLPST